MRPWRVYGLKAVMSLALDLEEKMELFLESAGRRKDTTRIVSNRSSVGGYGLYGSGSGHGGTGWVGAGSGPGMTNMGNRSLNSGPGSFGQFNGSKPFYRNPSGTGGNSSQPQASSLPSSANRPPGQPGFFQPNRAAPTSNYIRNPSYAASNPRSLPFRRLSQEEENYKRMNNLCFRCNERYSPGHLCKNTSLRVCVVDVGEAEGPQNNFEDMGRREQYEIGEFNQIEILAEEPEGDQHQTKAHGLEPDNVQVT